MLREQVLGCKISFSCEIPVLVKEKVLLMCDIKRLASAGRTSTESRVIDSPGSVTGEERV